MILELLYLAMAIFWVVYVNNIQYIKSYESYIKQLCPKLKVTILIIKI